MEASSSNNDNLVIPYLLLRKLIGAMGVALPVLVAVIPYALWVISDHTTEFPRMKESISEYYDSPSRDVFVGVLVALASFLASYRGHEDGQLKLLGKEVLGDNGLANISAICALATALFPVTSGQAWVRAVHVVAAATLFLVFAILALFQFTRGSNARENRVYRLCGYLVLGLLGCIGLYKFIPNADQLVPNLVFYLEAALLFVFGIAWTVKGRAIKAAL